MTIYNLMDRSVKVTYLKSGQYGPYKDSVYEAELKFDSSTCCGFDPDEDFVIGVVKLFVKDFVVDRHNPKEQHCEQLPHLAELKKISESTWFAKVVEPYTG